MDGKQIKNSIAGMGDVMPKIQISDAICKDLLKRGFKFVGSTICYAYMQAVGMVDSHFNDCWKKGRRNK